MSSETGAGISEHAAESFDVDRREIRPGGDADAVEQPLDHWTDPIDYLQVISAESSPDQASPLLEIR